MVELHALYLSERQSIIDPLNFGEIILFKGIDSMIIWAY